MLHGSCFGVVSSIRVLLPYPAPNSPLNCSGLTQSAPSLFSSLAYWFVCLFCREDICFFQDSFEEDIGCSILLERSTRSTRAKNSWQRTAKVTHSTEEIFYWHPVFPINHCFGLVSSIGVLLPYPVPNSSLNCLGLRWSTASLFTTLACWLVCLFGREDILFISKIHWKRILVGAYCLTDLQD